MKTFITALIMLALITGLVIWNAVELSHTMKELIALTEALPVNADEFVKNEKNDAALDALIRLWDRNFTRIALTSAYENLNRADEAIGSLAVHYQNDNANDFTHARLMAWDSLNRMKDFESFSLKNIF